MYTNFFNLFICNLCHYYFFCHRLSHHSFFFLLVEAIFQPAQTSTKGLSDKYNKCQWQPHNEEEEAALKHAENDIISANVLDKDKIFSNPMLYGFGPSCFSPGTMIAVFSISSLVHFPVSPDS